MTRDRYRSAALAALAVGLALAAGCKIRSIDGGPGTITGKVTDTTGAPLAGVRIEAGEQTTSSAAGGAFALKELPSADRLVINFTKAGYVLTSRVVRVRGGVETVVEAMLAAHEHVEQIDAASGGLVVSPSGAAVQLPAGALVDGRGQPFSGQAAVALTSFDPTTEAGQKAFPGDFAGVTAGGETIPFMSYGYLDVTITDDAGAGLQLAAGQTAAIAIPIPASLEADAPATMPLWYFDPADGKWHEQGSGARGAGVYEYEVDHFSIWNSDVGFNRSYVKGRVIDCDRRPVPGATVICRGITPRNCWTSGERSTDREGRFPADDDPWGFSYPGVPVDADSTFSIQAITSAGASAPKVLTARAAEQVLEVGDLCVCSTGPCGASGGKDGGVPPVDSGGGTIDGKYSFRIHSMVDTCDPNPGELGGNADVAIVGDQLTIAAVFPDNPEPMEFKGTVSAGGWYAELSRSEEYDGCTDSVVVRFEGTSDPRAGSFGGDFSWVNTVGGASCSSPQDCRADGKVDFVRK